MREYELIIDEALKNGLSPELITPFNTQVLFKCLGFRCGRFGLETYDSLENPLPVTVDMFYSWPFPQMLTGEKFNILVIRDDFSEEDIVYEISDDNSIATQIFVIDKLTYGQGTLMEVADFGEYIFMTNGVVMIYWDLSILAWQTVTSLINTPIMRTVCNFKGQLIGGNVVSSWPLIDPQCDNTFYVWGKIGDIDCTPDQENTSGYRRCPYGGDVTHVRRLNDKVIGYSNKGITLMTPVSDPATTFGFKELYDRGIINRGALNGSLQDHLFVDEDYNIVKILPDYVPKVLGYQKYMKELAGEDIIVSYDRKKGDYYIGNSTKTFLLSPNGLTEVPQHPSTVWRRNKESYMLPDTEDSYEPEIVTEVFNMSFSGQKTIATIESDVNGIVNPTAAIDWASNIKNFTTENYSPLNEQGSAAINGAGDFLRFRLKFESILDSFRISYLKARYKMTDLRSIRGVYAPPPRGQ